MNKRNISNYLSLAVNIKINVIFWFMIYEINKTQRFNNSQGPQHEDTSVCDRSMEIGTHDQDDLRKCFFKGDT